MNEKALIKKSFPNLKGATSFKVTSPATPQYNCIAWAAGVDTQWWWPIDGKFWPPNVIRVVTVQAFVAAFGTIGYEICETGALEDGFEKIVLYVDSKGEPTHAARQLPGGQWTSKLGESWDIAHKLPLGLEGHLYGTVSIFLKRGVAKAILKA